MQNIFTYGSLMFDPVWSRVVSGRYASSPATLHGYQRLAVKGEEYPVALPAAPASNISGILYLAVNPQDVQQLDDFEGEYYTRLQTPVTLDTGNALTAEVYILKPNYRHIAAQAEWDVEYFRATGIEAFLTRYRGFSHS